MVIIQRKATYTNNNTHLYFGVFTSLLQPSRTLVENVILRIKDPKYVVYICFTYTEKSAQQLVSGGVIAAARMCSFVAGLLPIRSIT